MLPPGTSAEDAQERLRRLPLPDAVFDAFVWLTQHGETPSVRKIHALTGGSFRDILFHLQILREPLDQPRR